MSDMSYLDPPIEIAATSPRLELIMSRLRSSGLRPYAASEQLDFESNGPLLVDIESVSRTTLEYCARACMRGLSRPMIILDVSDVGLNLSDVITLRRDRDLTMLKGRLAALARRESRNAEVAIRAETARAFGMSPPDSSAHTSPELIYVGEGSPIFLSLQGALKARGLSLTAAISPSTVRDYLSSRRFTAALFDLTSEQALDAIHIQGPQAGDMLSSVPIFALAILFILMAGSIRRAKVSINGFLKMALPCQWICRPIVLPIFTVRQPPPSMMMAALILAR